MKVIVALAFVAVVFAASCKCTTRCWERESASFDYGFATSTTAASLEEVGRTECDSFKASTRPLSPGLWTSKCQSHFDHYIMGDHCPRTPARFCPEKCPSDATCTSTGAQTLYRVCGQKSFAEFQKRIPYCADFELQTRKLVSKPNGKPQCE